LAGVRVLIAGGAGYIGSHMVKHLLDRQYGVIVVDDLSTGFRQLAGNAQLITGRIGDTQLLTQIFSQHQIAAVMHFAAFSQVGESVASPLKYYKNNICETVSLIETMVRSKLTISSFRPPPRSMVSLKRHPSLKRTPAGPPIHTVKPNCASNACWPAATPPMD
jgi:dTDP-D-glucose 4,6-dehydratase